MFFYVVDTLSLKHVLILFERGILYRIKISNYVTDAGMTLHPTLRFFFLGKKIEDSSIDY